MKITGICVDNGSNSPRLSSHARSHLINWKDEFRESLNF
jgi:hypothetical protein